MPKTKNIKLEILPEESKESFLFNLFPNEQYVKFLLEEENLFLIFTIFNKDKVSNIYYVSPKEIDAFYLQYLPYEDRQSNGYTSVLYKTSYVYNKKFVSIRTAKREWKSLKNRSKIIAIDIDEPFKKVGSKLKKKFQEIDKNLYNSSAFIKTHGKNVRILIFLKEEIDLESNEWSILKHFLINIISDIAPIDKISPVLTLWDTNVKTHWKKFKEKGKTDFPKIEKESTEFWNFSNVILKAYNVSKPDLNFLKEQEYPLNLPIPEGCETLLKEEDFEDNKREKVLEEHRYYTSDTFMERFKYHFERKFPGYKYDIIRMPSGKVYVHCPELKMRLKKTLTFVLQERPHELNMQFNFRKLISINHKEKKIVPQKRISKLKKSNPYKFTFICDSNIQTLASFICCVSETKEEFLYLKNLCLNLISNELDKWKFENLYYKNMNLVEYKFEKEEILQAISKMFDFIWNHNLYNEAGVIYNLMKNYSHIITKYLNDPNRLEKKSYVSPKSLTFFFTKVYSMLAYHHNFKWYNRYYSNHKGYLVPAREISKIVNQALRKVYGLGFRILLPDVKVILEMLGVDFEIKKEGFHIYFVIKNFPQLKEEEVERRLSNEIKKRIYIIKKFSDFKKYSVKRVVDFFSLVLKTEGIILGREGCSRLLYSFEGKRLSNELTELETEIWILWNFNDYALPDFNLIFDMITKRMTTYEIARYLGAKHYGYLDLNGFAKVVNIIQEKLGIENSLRVNKDEEIDENEIYEIFLEQWKMKKQGKDKIVEIFNPFFSEFNPGKRVEQKIKRGIKILKELDKGYLLWVKEEWEKMKSNAMCA